ncbi:hypothetical protein NEF87_001502 [Candidatus Lokiarchaeum ossiferum]|uniref:JAB1/MPN/MOV34 metalloenzyme domain-containing protein n=1 Tax=Candidatus Lokiarchaeum ossiferum TaxID=2951803 RepID=A0ABY6HS55_9ARCH|nr:hypothetical protein NEF87_001502 [Candidatus Lokiarchaeum sp. B-35]
MKLTPTSKVYLDHSAYQIMMEYALAHPNREVIGVFFGTKNEAAELFIEESYPFRVGNRQDVHFTDEDYVKVVPLIKNAESRDLDWLGWFHSHPFKGGDHIYMSHTDVTYHYPAQTQNPNWTAIVINPHQIQDPTTVRGMRAYRLEWNNKMNCPQKKVIELEMEVINDPR